MSDEDVVAAPRGLSKATLRGDSRGVYPYVHAAVRDTGGTIVTAEQDAMRAMRTLAKETEGLDVCYTSAMTVVAAAALRRSGWLDPESLVLLNLTGSDRADLPRARPHFLVYKEAGGFRMVAADDAITERVVGVVRRSVEIPEGAAIGADTVLAGGGLGLDSVAILELALALEEEFGCRLGEADFAPPRFRTIGAVADVIREKSRG